MTGAEIDGAPPRGRPPSTDRETVARVAFDLFAAHGFEETTMDDIASALGVGRRTVFRYFPSKNDLVWGDFGLVLRRLRDDLAACDPGLSTLEAIAAAAVSSNRYQPEQLPELRLRLKLITTVPALQAHSMLRYAAWRDVIAEYAALRRGEPVGSVIPQTIAHAALGVSIAAFAHWVTYDDADLEHNLREAYAGLVAGFPTDL